MRTIDETKAEAKLRELTRDDPMNGPLAVGSVVERFLTWLRRQPRAPHLVARQEAARLLGVESPHIARFQAQGRMPDPIEVDGGPNVWIKAEVVAFRKLLDREERERRKARERKEADQRKREATRRQRKKKEAQT